LVSEYKNNQYQEEELTNIPVVQNIPGVGHLIEVKSWNQTICHSSEVAKCVELLLKNYQEDRKGKAGLGALVLSMKSE
jgi:hypothetical protein